MIEKLAVEQALDQLARSMTAVRTAIADLANGSGADAAGDAAHALSGGAIEQSSGYAGSLECAASLALFVQTIENSPLIDQTQADALRRARRLFNERAKTEGLAEGKSPSAVDAAITRATDNATDDPARSSRTAIACIRQLAGEAR